MSFSIEASIVVPSCILIIAGICIFSFRSADDTNRNAVREARQDAARQQNERIYQPVYRDDRTAADLQSNPLELLRFCIYVEDQAKLLQEVWGND